MKHGDCINEFSWLCCYILHRTYCANHNHDTRCYRYLHKPYRPEMNILHWMEVFYILGISVSLTHHMFLGFLNFSKINYGYPVTIVWGTFAFLDLIFSPIFTLICFFMIKLICTKTKSKIISIYVTLRRRYGKSVS